MDTYILWEDEKKLSEFKNIEPIEFILKPNVNYRYTLNERNIFIGSFDFKMHTILKGREIHFLALA